MAFDSDKVAKRAWMYMFQGFLGVIVSIWLGMTIIHFADSGALQVGGFLTMMAGLVVSILWAALNVVDID